MIDMLYQIFSAQKATAQDERLTTVENTLGSLMPGLGTYEKENALGFRFLNHNLEFEFTNQKTAKLYDRNADQIVATYDNNLERVYVMTNEAWLSENFTFLETPKTSICGKHCNMYLPIKAKKAFSNGAEISTIPERYQPACVVHWTSYTSEPKFSLRAGRTKLVAVGNIAVNDFAYLYADYLLEYIRP